MKESIIFIAPTTSQPRFHKRVNQLKNSYCVKVFAYERGYYNENSFPDDVIFYSLGTVENGEYLSRIFKIFSAIKTINKKITKKDRQLFYALSLDCLIIGRLCGFKVGVYEVGDLIYTKKYLRILLFIEKIALRRIAALILTSRFFYDDFYKSLNIIPQEKVLIIDNKVNPFFLGKRKIKTNFQKQKIVIGMIGLFRFRKPIELLLTYIKNKKDTHILKCYGDGPYRNIIESSVCENIQYYGSFKNPNDLENIYNSVNVNYVVYDYNDRNVQLALPNKLFESAFFGVPILCGNNTALGALAKNWNIGKQVSIENLYEFEADMNEVDYYWINEKSKNCYKIPEEELIDDGEKQISRLLGFL